jgi:hypothetical protein
MGLVVFLRFLFMMVVLTFWAIEHYEIVWLLRWLPFLRNPTPAARLRVRGGMTQVGAALALTVSGSTRDRIEATARREELIRAALSDAAMTSLEQVVARQNELIRDMNLELRGFRAAKEAARRTALRNNDRGLGTREAGGEVRAAAGAPPFAPCAILDGWDGVSSIRPMGSGKSRLDIVRARRSLICRATLREPLGVPRQAAVLLDKDRC